MYGDSTRISNIFTRLHGLLVLILVVVTFIESTAVDSVDDMHSSTVVEHASADDNISGTGPGSGMFVVTSFG